MLLAAHQVFIVFCKAKYHLPLTRFSSCSVRPHITYRSSGFQAVQLRSDYFTYPIPGLPSFAGRPQGTYCTLRSQAVQLRPDYIT